MKIAISGAGVAGPTLAYWLHRLGHEPTMIEVAPRFRRGGYVIDFWGAGYEVAQRMGLEDELLSSGYAVDAIRMVKANGTTAARLDAEVFRRVTAGRFTSLPRGELAHAIYRLVEQSVETIFGDQIISVDETPDYVRLGFQHRSAREFDLLIGADGLHSAVRRLIFADLAGEVYLGCGIAAFEVAGYDPRSPLEYVAYNIPGGQIARFSLRCDRTLFMFLFRANQSTIDSVRCRKGVAELLNRRFANAGWESDLILARIGESESLDQHHLYFDKVSQIRLPVWSRGRVALTGDAAACVSLLGGEGAGLAMVEAYVLAGEIGLSPDDHAAAFAVYESRLRPLVAAKQQSALSFASMFVPKTRLGIWLRNRALNAMKLKRIADKLVAPALSDDFALPNYGP